MTLKKGTVHLTVPLIVIIAAVWVFVAYLLINKGLISRPALLKKEPTVELKTQYQNPFKKETQYVNPFDQYKSPFSHLR